LALVPSPKIDERVDDIPVMPLRAWDWKWSMRAPTLAFDINWLRAYPYPSFNERSFYGLMTLDQSAAR
jgi:hypothetical protein